MTTTYLTTTTGRRKRSVARVRISSGTGVVTVNGRAFDDYFPSATHRNAITEPMRITDCDGTYDLSVTMDGGGQSGQAGALRHGLTRALMELDPERRGVLKPAGFVTRDPRKKESKKYGLKKARKAPQYSKR